MPESERRMILISVWDVPAEFSSLAVSVRMVLSCGTVVVPQQLGREQLVRGFRAAPTQRAAPSTADSPLSIIHYVMLYVTVKASPYGLLAKRNSRYLPPAIVFLPQSSHRSGQSRWWEEHMVGRADGRKSYILLAFPKDTVRHFFVLLPLALPLTLTRSSSSPFSRSFSLSAFCQLFSRLFLCSGDDSW